ncbi:shikimate dehydrogenase [soil metagenome]
MAAKLDSGRKKWRLALLGQPVSQSLSPLIYEAAFAADDEAVSYLLCETEEAAVPAALIGLRARGFHGANVTIPHKQRVARLIAALTPEATLTGAVNCIEIRGGGHLVGHNTDVAGFLEPLAPHLQSLHGHRALILGAGGAALAVSMGLSQIVGMNITVAARRRKRSEEVVERVCTGTSEGISVADVDETRLKDYRLIVNATPVGMHPLADSSPLGDNAAFNAGQIVYDLIYSPAETRLIATARLSGAEVIGGLPMLIGQAANAYLIWTGREMNRGAVLAHLGSTGKSSFLA